MDEHKLAVYTKSIVTNVCLPNTLINNRLEIASNYRIFLEQGDLLKPLSLKSIAPATNKGGNANRGRGGKANVGKGRPEPAKVVEVIPEETEEKLSAITGLEIELGNYENVYYQYSHILKVISQVTSDFIEILFENIEENQGESSADNEYIQTCLSEIAKSGLFENVKKIIVNVEQLCPVLKDFLTGMIYHLLYIFGKKGEYRSVISMLTYKGLKNTLGNTDLNQMENCIHY